MTTRKELRTEEEWNDFWADFFGEDIEIENYSKDDERIKHRKDRCVNRKHKKRIVEKNKPRQQREENRAKRISQISKKEVKPKRISLYRLVDNGKNKYPSKPTPRREKNVFLEEISEVKTTKNEVDEIENNSK